MCHEPLQNRRIEAVPRYEPLFGLCPLQWLRAMALALAYERGTQRARARAYGAGHIQALRHVFPVDVGLHSESAFWITRRITPDPRKAGELILSQRSETIHPPSGARLSRAVESSVAPERPKPQLTLRRPVRQGTLRVPPREARLCHNRSGFFLPMTCCGSPRAFLAGTLSR